MTLHREQNKHFTLRTKLMQKLQLLSGAIYKAWGNFQYLNQN